MTASHPERIGMSGFFKASVTALAIIGCAAVIMLGILLVFFSFTMVERGEPLDYGLIAGGAMVALVGGLSLHLLLRQTRRSEVLEDEGW